ncbi:unnamed protein product [Ambrosiozyma monospora]|uniref:Unnamed protein product n=1 Tax=Ambrosiozyma monospora TaxID=43982 RepID=A0A9W6YWM5_AMBMO|nr:unnamed protein product [Ambrosiozyma monospora]
MQTWNFTEETLQSALQVRLEQEKTKQEYYKAEALNRSLEIMKMAIHTKVPGHLIPTLFNVSDDTMMKLNQIQMQQIGQQKKAASAALLSPFRSAHDRTTSDFSVGHHRRSSSSTSGASSISSDNRMQNFKFGSGSTASPTPPRKTSLSIRHQLSPSKIGAHSILKSLASYDDKPHCQTTLANLRHGGSRGRFHQRTSSLPASVCIPESQELNFNKSKLSITTNRSDIIEIPNLVPDSPSKKRKTMGFELPSPGKQGHQRTSSNTSVFETPIKKDIASGVDESFALPSPQADSPVSKFADDKTKTRVSLPKFPNDILS